MDIEKEGNGMVGGLGRLRGQVAGGGLEEEANGMGGLEEGMVLHGDVRKQKGRGRTHCLASIKSMDNSCYLLRTSPPSKEPILGNLPVQVKVPGGH